MPRLGGSTLLGAWPCSFLLSNKKEAWEKGRSDATDPMHQRDLTDPTLSVGSPPLSLREPLRGLSNGSFFCSLSSRSELCEAPVLGLSNGSFF